MTRWCRFFSRAGRRRGEWRLLTFDAIYGKHRLDPVLPGAPIELDTARLEQARRSCRYLTYLDRQGVIPSPTTCPAATGPISSTRSATRPGRG